MAANASSFVLVLRIKPDVDGGLEILYESIYQRDEIVVLVWCAKLGLGQYQWLHGPNFS